MDSLKLSQFAAEAAKEKKASRVVVLDLRNSSDICEFQMICSGDNDRQTRAIAQAIEDHCLKQTGIRPIAIEGKQSGHWILLDYGALTVHVFFSYIRDYYALEEIWPNAKKVALEATEE